MLSILVLILFAILGTRSTKGRLTKVKPNNQNSSGRKLFWMRCGEQVKRLASQCRFNYIATQLHETAGEQAQAYDEHSVKAQ